MKNTISILFSCVASAFLLLSAQNLAAQTDPSEVLKQLQEGNKHFVQGKLRAVDYNVKRMKVAESQSPKAIVLTCSDSRVPPEIIFDQSLGSIFTVRVAGNVADSVGIGSMEYAATNLGSHLLVVLGHSSCGAVKAALGSGELPPNIAAITRRIASSALRAKDEKKNSTEQLDRATELNVLEQMHYLTDHSEIIRKMTGDHSLKIVGGVYDLASGKVRWLAEEKN